MACCRARQANLVDWWLFKSKKWSFLLSETHNYVKSVSVSEIKDNLFRPFTIYSDTGF